MTKKPAKKPAARLTTRDGKPVVFPKTWGQVTSSSRTQPPKQPGKVARVKKPRNSTFMQVYHGEIMVTEVGVMDSSEARKHAAWLLHAAAYIEQEARTS